MQRLDSTALKLYEGITDEASLLQFIARSEGLFVDYKCKRNHSDAGVDPDLRKNIRRAISGFANASGGILVVGVEDKTKNVTPIFDLSRFKQNVDAEVLQATAYQVEGIETKPIHVNGGSSGILLMYVPMSNRAPHMSLDDRKYYLRSGDKFLTMEHHQVESMFGQRLKPFLIPSARVKKNLDRPNSLELVLIIENRGHVLARFPKIEVYQKQSFTPYMFGLSAHRTGLPEVMIRLTSWAFAGGADHVIHQNSSVEISRFIAKLGQPQSARISGNIVAEGYSLREWKIEISEELVKEIFERSSSSNAEDYMTAQLL